MLLWRPNLLFIPTVPRFNQESVVTECHSSDQRALNSEAQGWWVRCHGYPHLMITLGGINQGFGIPPFEFVRSLEGMPCDMLFLRDFSQAWYHLGVDQQRNSLAALLTSIQEFIQQRGYRNVVVLGNSMGGYGAILLGHLLQANTVLAFAPQTFIGPWLRRWHGDQRWREQLANVHASPRATPAYFDLKRVLKSGKGAASVLVYYSPVDALDAVHARRMHGLPGVEVHAVADGAHEVVRVLRDNGTLHLLVRTALMTDQGENALKLALQHAHLDGLSSRRLPLKRDS